MNTIGGIALCLAIGVIAWGLCRAFWKMPAWSTKAFWIAAIGGVLIGAKLSEPANMAVMSVFAGTIVAEHLHTKWQIRVARKAEQAKEAKASRKKQSENQA